MTFLGFPEDIHFIIFFDKTKLRKYNLQNAFCIYLSSSYVSCIHHSYSIYKAQSYRKVIRDGYIIQISKPPVTESFLACLNPVTLMKTDLPLGGFLGILQNITKSFPHQNGLSFTNKICGFFFKRSVEIPKVRDHQFSTYVHIFQKN